MKSNTLRVAGLCLPFLFIPGAVADDLVFTTFYDSQWNNTAASSINAEGTVAGTVGGIGIRGSEGFVRDRQGKITTFSLVPPYPVSGIFSGTSAFGINRDGDIVGTSYINSPAEFIWGFVREEDGTITRFAPPEGPVSPPDFINSAGEIAGTYHSGGTLGPSYGFIRDAQGNIQTFSVPGQKNFLSVTGLNSNGDVVGWYYTTTQFNQQFCFIRYNDGTVFPFNVPGAYDSQAAGINDEGDIVGSYEGGKHGFVRDASGEFTHFDVPGATSISPAAINNGGQIVGSYTDAQNVGHGFLRRKNGQVVIVDVPNATSTSVVDININGEMTGTYATANGTASFVARLCGCSPRPEGD